jgi:hypothetical protein
MSPEEFEIAFFAQTVWRVARSSNADELAAVANTIRNHVIPRRLGQVATYESFTAACLDFLKVYSTRDFPSMTDPAFVSHPEGLLSQISEIYTCDAPDITATHDHPNGAKYFNRVQNLLPEDWFYQEIVQKSGQHALIGTFGSMQFFE